MRARCGQVVVMTASGNGHVAPLELARKLSLWPIVGDPARLSRALNPPFRAMADAVDGAIDKVQGLRRNVERLRSKEIRVRAIVEGLGSVIALQEHLSLVRSQGTRVPIDSHQHGGVVSGPIGKRGRARGSRRRCVLRGAAWGMEVGLSPARWPTCRRGREATR